ncbi:MAG: hydroxymethylbilane synthase [Desulfobulbus sp.]|jgi:hydroxymethylbilane synthase
MRTELRLGTRASLLALTQSTHIKEQIERAHPNTRVELVRITTKGDRILDVPLAKVGGKGLFVKEIEDALLSGAIDLAVHSMKDVPSELPAGLIIGIVPEREAPWDALLSPHAASIAELPVGARVGTSSLRRKAQLSAIRSDLQILDLRGNVDTRIRKLDEGQYDAIILAAAGLRRLEKAERITALLAAEEMLPAVGQGALGIELREQDTELQEGLAFLRHQPTEWAVAAERAFLFRLEGGCQVPIAAHAVLKDDTLALTGLIATVDGRRILKETATGLAGQAGAIGRALADSLLAQGGRAILDEVYAHDTASSLSPQPPDSRP